MKQERKNKLNLIDFYAVLIMFMAFCFMPGNVLAAKVNSTSKVTNTNSTIESRDTAVKYTVTYDVGLTDTDKAVSLTITDTLPYGIDINKSIIDAEGFDVSYENGKIVWSKDLRTCDSEGVCTDVSSLAGTFNIELTFTDISLDTSKFTNPFAFKVVYSGGSSSKNVSTTTTIKPFTLSTKDTLKVTGNEEIATTENEVTYNVDYNGTANNYNGDVLITITDTLPYEVEELPAIDGYEVAYGSNNKIITFKKTVSINTCTSQTSCTETEIKDNFSYNLKYKDIDLTKSSFQNNLKIEFRTVNGNTAATVSNIKAITYLTDKLTINHKNAAGETLADTEIKSERINTSINYSKYIKDFSNEGYIYFDAEGAYNANNKLVIVQAGGTELTIIYGYPTNSNVKVYVGVDEKLYIDTTRYINFNGINNLDAPIGTEGIARVKKVDIILDGKTFTTEETRYTGSDEGLDYGTKENPKFYIDDESLEEDNIASIRYNGKLLAGYKDREFKFYYEYTDTDIDYHIDVYYVYSKEDTRYYPDYYEDVTDVTNDIIDKLAELNSTGETNDIANDLYYIEKETYTFKGEENVDIRYKYGFTYQETEDGVIAPLDIGFTKEIDNVPYTRWVVNPGIVGLGIESVANNNIRGGIGYCGEDALSPNCKLSASDRIYGKMVHGDIPVFVWYGPVPVLKVNNIVINDPVDNNKLTEEKEYAYLEGTRANVTRIRDELLPEDLKYTYNEVKLNNEVISTDEDATKEKQLVIFQKYFNNLTFYYTRYGYIEAKYIDIDTKEEIADSMVCSDKIGLTGNCEELAIANYRLVTIPEEVAYGSKDNMPIVYYEYAKILGNLYIHYVDEINNSLLPDDTKTGQINVGEYTTNSKEIDKYRNVSVNTTDKEATIDEESYTVSGNYKEKDIHVFYIYKPLGIVTVKYIDADTQEALADPLTLTDLVGNTYATTAKEIAEYTLVNEYDHVNGEYTSEDIVIIYEYTRNKGKVIVYFIDNDTNNEITDSTTIEGKTKETYNTSDIKNNFENAYPHYTYLKDSQNTTGEYASEDTEVYYYYVKNSGDVIIHHLDNRTGRTIHEDTSMHGYYDEEYTTKSEDINGYQVKFSQGITNGYYGDNITTEVTYYYESLGKVITRHIDYENRDIVLADEEEKVGTTGSEYTTKEANIENYTLYEIDGDKTGIYGIDSYNNPIIVTYMYLKNTGKVIIHYLDNETKEEIIENKELSDKVLESYEVRPEDIKNYTYVSSSNNTTGTYQNEDINVYFYYELNKGKVIINYVDELGNSLHESNILTDAIGASYETKPIEIANYELSGTPNNSEGTYTDKDIIVVYVYNKIQEPVTIYGSLEVNYVDTDGIVISKQFNDTKEVGTPYETEKLTIDGYTYKFVIGAITGEYTEGKTIVTYVYEKNTEEVIPDGKVIVRYIENTGRRLYEDDIVIEDKVGETYTTEQKSFDGYKFISVQGETQGKIELGKKYVIYIYEKEKTASDNECQNNCCQSNCCVTTTCCPNNCDNQSQDETKTGIVLVHYEDKEGNMVASDSTLEGSVGANYATVRKLIENYKYLRVYGAETGKYSDSVIIVTYIYEKTDSTTEPINNPTEEKTGRVLVHYVDEDYNLLLDDELFNGKVGEEYAIPAKKIAGYNLINIEKINKTKARLMALRAVNTNSNNIGSYIDGTIELYFIYSKVEESNVEPVNVKETGTVIVKYINTDGIELAKSVTITKDIDEAYNTTKLDITGYTLKTVIGDVTGKIEKGTKQVTYLYEKNIGGSSQDNECTNCPKGIVIVRYEAVDNTLLIPEEIMVDSVDANYATIEKTFDGYTLKTINGNKTGKYIDGVITVTYIYSLKDSTPVKPTDTDSKTGKVITTYVDMEGNKISGSITVTLEVGKEYNTVKKDIAGYTLKTVVGDEVVKVTAGTTNVVYLYEKNIGGSSFDEEPKDNPNNNVEVLPPQTGINNNNNTSYIVLLILNILTLFGYIFKNITKSI